MRKTLAPLLFVFLIGCGTVLTPQTARERLAAAEVSYQTAATTILNLNASGVIKSGTDTARMVISSAQTANSGLSAWRATVDSPVAESAAMAALRALQTLLVGLQK